MLNLMMLNTLGMMSMMGLTKKRMLWMKANKNMMSKSMLLLCMMSLYMVMNELNSMNMNDYGYLRVMNMLNMDYGYDGMGLMFMMLTMYLGVMSMMSNWENMMNKRGTYMMLLMLLVMLMGLNFMCLDLMSFYMFFESTLMPLYLMMGMYGGSNKNKAAYYVLIYTLCSSLFMLLSMMLMYVMYNNVDYVTMNSKMMSMELQSVLLMGLMMGLGVKTPLVPVHTWLPTVHSESPLGGSMLLAGMVLKLAMYGMMRMLLSNMSEMSLLYAPMLYVMGMMTMMYSSLVTLSQTDLKVIMAYSSISHLGVCMLGMFANNLLGIIGSLILCLAHGFVSPALFILMGGVLYDRYHNRVLFYYQGLTQFMPLFAVYLVFFSFSNTGTPLSYNFIGEFLCITGAIISNPTIGIFTALSVLLSACYQMKLTNKLTSGTFSKYLHVTYDLLYRENFILFFLALPTLVLGIVPNFINNILYLSSNALIYSIVI
ncbi:NADH dehydrogenase subunit 4 (mitochondrion) [Pichia kudriavzevii]|uniref:NADH-ubiquinone oxidoreductase chain 4 n=1 Tax=Pichia kudriavzevii TaxID=4909 RepID=A0A2U9RCH4_PICKU|nr:NADH dehydrogenase subunit 4 [Pichia kudriavzevii]